MQICTESLHEEDFGESMTSHDPAGTPFAA